MHACYVSRWNIEPFWNDVAPEIERALKHSYDEVQIAQLRHLLLTGEAHLTVVFDEEGKICGVCTTEIVAYPNKRGFRVITLGGRDMEEWLDMLIEHLEEGARNCQCDWLEFSGRRGWTKVLEKRGWRSAYVAMHKDIKAGELWAENQAAAATPRS